MFNGVGDETTTHTVKTLKKKSIIIINHQVGRQTKGMCIDQLILLSIERPTQNENTQKAKHVSLLRHIPITLKHSSVASTTHSITMKSLLVPISTLT